MNAILIDTAKWNSRLLSFLFLFVLVVKNLRGKWNDFLLLLLLSFWLLLNSLFYECNLQNHSDINLFFSFFFKNWIDIPKSKQVEYITEMFSDLATMLIVLSSKNTWNETKRNKCSNQFLLNGFSVKWKRIVLSTLIKLEIYWTNLFLWHLFLWRR